MTDFTLRIRNRLETIPKGASRSTPGAKGSTNSVSPAKTRAKGSIGIYYIDSRSKRHQGKPDKCYYIAYRDSLRKLVWEKIGWASRGYTKEMASNIRAERVRAVRHGEELPKRRNTVTLGQVWKKYDEWLDSNKKQPWDDRSRWRKHLEENFANAPLNRISPIDLENLKAQLLKQGKSPATVKHVLVLARQLFNKAIAWEMWAGENPIKRVKLPKLNNRRERFLTYEEAHKLIEELEKASAPIRDMALVSLSCGLRAGEIYQLRWGHVDFNNGLIHVADSKSNIKKAPMTAMLAETLAERGPGEPGELVFKDRNGNSIQEVSNSFSRAVDRLGWNEGIEDRRQRVTFHTLRRTYASWLAIQGTSILTIKELMGHKTLAMTERYSHLIPDVKQSAVQKMEEAFLAGQMSKQHSSEKNLPS